MRLDSQTRRVCAYDEKKHERGSMRDVFHVLDNIMIATESRLSIANHCSY